MFPDLIKKKNPLSLAFSQMLFKQGFLKVCLIRTLLGVYQLTPGLMTLTLFQGTGGVRIINCKFVFRFLSTVVYMLYGSYIHERDESQYALCDWSEQSS